jgi:hypothetical protein
LVLPVGAIHVNVTVPAVPPDVIVDPVLELPPQPPRTKAMTNKVVN